jgi:transketolase C-terminal domain/subunit
VTTQETFDCRDSYTRTLLDIARTDRNVIVVVND